MSAANTHVPEGLDVLHNAIGLEQLSALNGALMELPDDIWTKVPGSSQGIYRLGKTGLLEVVDGVITMDGVSLNDRLPALIDVVALPLFGDPRLLRVDRQLPGAVQAKCCNKGPAAVHMLHLFDGVTRVSPDLFADPMSDLSDLPMIEIELQAGDDVYVQTDYIQQGLNPGDHDRFIVSMTNSLGDIRDKFTMHQVDQAIYEADNEL